ncbi:hypothetical protein LAZ67_X001892 [Cordylochernes scorpioides]|uniref:Integrase catalytic domain-containing protein n=1 Tax=Cordylochernes scorpioides TaxID=51811 RepID=A0ABY6LTZ1_9ARAC|nr:hypothetical protein LAZ67_X001892 [Cordylochernes scorpioides]
MITETELKMRQEIRAMEILEFELALLKNEKDSKLLAIQEVSDQDLSSEEEAVDGSLQAGLRAQDVDKLVDVFTKVLQQQQKVIVKSTMGDTTLPHFDGAVERWIEFKEEFNRTTSEYHISDSRNIIQLRKALSGKAYNHVKHLIPYVANVKLIMEALEQRFGQPRFIIKNLLRTAQDCPQLSVQKPDTILGLNISVKGLISSCMTLAQPQYLESIELLDTLTRKLPAEMKEQWYAWILTSNRQETLFEFSNWLDFKAKLAIRWGPGVVNVAAGEGTEKNKHYSCPACSDRHTLSKCDRWKDLDLNQKWKIIKRTRPSLCTSCLRQERHRSCQCLKNEICDINGCEKIHHRSLHNYSAPQGENSSQETSKLSSSQQDNPTSGSVNITVVNGEAVIKGCDGPLPIIPVVIKGPSGKHRTYALLDTGASRTLISKGLADSVGLEGKSHHYSYGTSSGETVMEPNAVLVNCEVAGTFRGAPYRPMQNAVNVSSLKMRPYSISIKKMRHKWPHLNKVKAQDLKNVVPELIIGINNLRLILPRELALGPPDAPIGWRTLLGWTVGGNFYDLMETQGCVNYTVSEPINDNDLHELIKSSFSTENFGVIPRTRWQGMNQVEGRAYDILQKTTKRTGACWETGLLWRDAEGTLSESYQIALGRLRHKERKLAKDPLLLAAYKGKFDEYLEKGYIRKLDSIEVTKGSERTWYISHFGVTNPNKPGKLRLVFGAAARSNGVSLNEALSKGPDLISPLTSVLWKFRVHNIALTGDITDMFHRVRVIKEDQCNQRFLWRNMNTSIEPDHYEMQVLIFGATSSPYSEENCMDLRRELSEVNSAGGFHLCKFNSNSRAVIESIPEELRAKGVKSLNEKSVIPAGNVLGMWWDPTKDIFGFKFGLNKVPPEILEGAVPTKCQACSLTMSVYDPLGLVNHFKIKGIIILQRTWIAGIGWDEELTPDIYAAWKRWLSKLKEIHLVQVPRCYHPDLLSRSIIRQVEVHTFVDASQEAFSAVTYLRVETRNGNITTILFGPKARVAPLKKLTISKLELQGCVLGTRFAVLLRSELRLPKVDREVFWSDSKTVLAWIRSEAGRYKEFVANRVGEIQEATKGTDWRWVPTSENPADIATRFETEISFEPTDMWYTGPEFLKRPEEEWPKEAKGKDLGIILATRMLKLGDDTRISPSSDVECGRKSNKLIRKISQRLLPEKKFETFAEIERCVMVVWKAAKLWRDKTQRKRPRLHLCRAAAVQKAARFWCKKTFHKSGELNPPWKAAMENNKVRQHRFIVRPEEYSRILQANKVPAEQKTPAILPSDHHVTELLIQAEHERCSHQGSETLLNNLRGRFWIIDGRQTVLRTIRKCPRCRLSRAPPVIPEMGQLPHYRLAAYRRSFTFTGLDAFEPFTVTVGRRHEKRWVIIFTLIHDGFIDTRGRPDTIYSANGTNFVRASKELKLAASEIDFEVMAASGRFGPFKWKFNPPAAPHFGGAWERFIKSVKKCLRATLNEVNPKDTTLLTALKSAENIINSRPLTYVSSDPTEEDSLTPNHFLRGANDAG